MPRGLAVALRTRARAIGLLAALASALPACARAAPTSGIGDVDSGAASSTPASFPVSVRDGRDATVTVRAEPHRIVALLPSETETLFALGVGGRLVGVDDYSRLPSEASRLPRLGGLYDVHFEELMGLEPDLVLLSGSRETAAHLEASGLAVWAGDVQTFDDVFRVIAAIGSMVGRSTEAARLSMRIAADVGAIEASVQGRPPVRVYFEIDATPYTVGPRSFIGTMLTKAGGENIVPDGLGEFPRISPEAVIAGNPEIILNASLDSIRGRPGWSAIDAVRSARVYELPRSEAEVIKVPGPRLAEGVRVLARRLHPELSR
jgi:iron complex transport system substrate-binding protein